MTYPCVVKTENLNSIGRQIRFGVSSYQLEPGYVLGRTLSDLEDTFEAIEPTGVVIVDTEADIHAYEEAGGFCIAS